MRRPALRREIFFFAVIILSTLLVVWPLFKPGFIVTDDGEWMIIRLSAFFQSLREGQFPVRFITRLNANYGYPVSNFLYPGFLYIGSVFHGLGLSFIDSIKAIFIFSVIGGGIGIYLWLRTYFSKSASCVGSLAYIFAPYLSYDLYSRGSVGEILAMSVATFGLYSISSKKTWLFPFVIALLIVSHNTLGLIFCVLLSAYIFILKATEFIPPFLLGIGMAVFFWIPALYERRFVIFDSISISEPERYFIGVSQLWLYGISTLLALIILLFVKQKKYQKVKSFIVLSYLLSIFLASPLSGFFWSGKTFALMFQFPFRLLSVVVLVGAWIVSYSVDMVREQKRGVLLVGYSLLWILSLFFEQRSLSYVQRPDGYYSTNEASTTVRDEYLPKWANKTFSHRADLRVEFVSGSGVIEKQPTSSQHIEFDVDSMGESTIQVNTIFYPGWGASVDGQPAVIDYQNLQGLMRLLIPSGKHHVIVEFRETILRFTCNILTIAFFLVSIVYAYQCIKKNSKGKS